MAVRWIRIESDDTADTVAGRLRRATHWSDVPVEMPMRLSDYFGRDSQYRFRGSVALDGRFALAAYRRWTVTLGVEAVGEVAPAAAGSVVTARVRLTPRTRGALVFMCVVFALGLVMAFRTRADVGVLTAGPVFVVWLVVVVAHDYRALRRALRETASTR